MHNRLFRIFSILIIVTLLLSGCSGTRSAEVRPPLNIAWIVWPGEFPHLIAQDKGFFEKHGLSVNLIQYDSQSVELADLQSGRVDGGVFALTDVMALSANNPGKFRIVLAVDSSQGADAIVAVPEIATVANLKGKRAAANLGTQTEFFLRYALKANGLSVADITLVDMDPESVPGALGAQIEAGHTWDPSLSEAVDAGNHIIFSSEDAPGLLTDVLVFRKSVVDARPEDVRVYVTAWFETLDYWEANPEECKPIIAKYTGLSPEEVSSEGVKLFTLADNQQAFQPGTDTTSLYYTGQLNLDFLTTIGAISKTLDMKQLFDPEFIQ